VSKRRAKKTGRRKAKVKPKAKAKVKPKSKTKPKSKSKAKPKPKVETPPPPLARIESKDKGPAASARPEQDKELVGLLDAVAKSKPASVEDVMSELRAITKKLRQTSSMVCSEEDFRTKVEHLKTMCPPPKSTKVKVSRVDPSEMTDEHGYVTKERNTFEVILADNLTEYETEHVLLHEWAHVLGWRPYHPLQGDHGGDWGVWYATIWRKFHGVE
jgi:hypothetical protein